ncbi:hypothetical protein GW915_00415 [bacterium]|nr:hypothetical protein [bacterium]
MLERIKGKVDYVLVFSLTVGSPLLFWIGMYGAPPRYLHVSAIITTLAAALVIRMALRSLLARNMRVTNSWKEAIESASHRVANRNIVVLASELLAVILIICSWVLYLTSLMPENTLVRDIPWSYWAGVGIGACTTTFLYHTLVTRQLKILNLAAEYIEAHRKKS